jgi:hypothetical protein
MLNKLLCVLLVGESAAKFAVLIKSTDATAPSYVDVRALTYGVHSQVTAPP